MPQASQARRPEYIAGLRQLADWLEQHPDAAAPYVMEITVPLTDNAEVAEFAAAADVDVVTDENGNTSASVKFGPLVYRAYGYANWGEWKVQHDEKTAHGWADENDMVIQPREGGDES